MLKAKSSTKTKTPVDPKKKKQKSLKVLLVFDTPYAFPRGYDYLEEFADHENMYVENEVHIALKDNKHQVRLVGLYNDIWPLYEEIESFQPDVIFNQVELFHDNAGFDKNIAGLLELTGIPFTGASSRSLFVCNDKALTKKILSYHGVNVPKFHVFHRQNKAVFPSHLKLPCFVKPNSEEASTGISQASVVTTKRDFIRRVRYIKKKLKKDVIAEEYIEGRELYVSVMGNKKIQVLPPREMKFGKRPPKEPKVATYQTKWDMNYRKRWGITNVFTGPLPKGVRKEITEVCKHAYRALELQSYARFDLRLTPQGKIYFLEANANPCLAEDDEIAKSAGKVRLPYYKMINRIVELALIRQKTARD